MPLKLFNGGAAAAKKNALDSEESDVEESDLESVESVEDPVSKKFLENNEDEEDDEEEESGNEDSQLEESENEDDDLDTESAEADQDPDVAAEGIDSETEMETKAKKKKKKQMVPLDDPLFDNEDTENIQNDQYYQKIKQHIKRSIVLEHHSEIQFQNHEEIETLSQVVRNQNGQIIDPFHTTVPFLTKYEKADVLGKRASQINEGAPLFTDVDPSVIDGYLIALKEFEEKKIPFIIQRPLPNGSMEYWKLQDLEIL